MTTIDRSKTSNLRTADSKNSLHVDGIGTIGILEDVKFCERATTDLIAVSKLGQIGFKTSFDDAEGPVVIRRRSTGNVVCIGVQMNDLYWITEDQFMDIACIDGKNIEKEHRRSELVSMGTEVAQGPNQPLELAGGWMSQQAWNKVHGFYADDIHAGLSVVENEFVINEKSDYYFDVSCNLSVEMGVCSLASSVSKDMLELMHERTGHANKNMLVECFKRQLVSGLKISNKHVRKLQKSDTHVCDFCARAKITRQSLNKYH